MQSLKVTIDAGDGAEPIELEAVDLAMALAVTDINVEKGTAEISDGEQVIARLRKRGDGTATFWEVGADRP